MKNTGPRKKNPKKNKLKKNKWSVPKGNSKLKQFFPLKACITGTYAIDTP